jgi:hypothetical protein
VNKDSHRSIAPEAHHGGQCEGERECEGRKCPHTQTQTHTFLFYVNKDSHRSIAPEAHHGGQCEGGV